MYASAGIANLVLQHPLAAACALIHAAMLLLTTRPRGAVARAASFVVTTVLVATGGMSFAVLYLLVVLPSSRASAISIALAASIAIVVVQGARALRAENVPTLLLLPTVALVMAATEYNRDVEESIRSEHSDLETSRRLLEQELAIAHDIQLALLPRAGEQIDGWESAFRFFPTREVGGDLIQFLRDEGQLGVVVADIAGKGIPAAILVGAVHQLLHRVSHLSFEKMLSELNAALCATTPDEISVAMTLIWASPTDDVVRYVVAGAPPPLVIRQSGMVEVLDGGDLAMGWLDDSRYVVRSTVLDEGETLVIYTDGLIDSIDAAGARLEVEGAIAMLTDAQKGDLEALAARLEAVLHARKRTDDVSFVLLRRANRNLRAAET